MSVKIQGNSTPIIVDLPKSDVAYPSIQEKNQKILNKFDKALQLLDEDQFNNLVKIFSGRVKVKNCQVATSAFSVEFSSPQNSSKGVVTQLDSFGRWDAEILRLVRPGSEPELLMPKKAMDTLEYSSTKDAPPIGVLITGVDSQFSVDKVAMCVRNRILIDAVQTIAVPKGYKLVDGREQQEYEGERKLQGIPLLFNRAYIDVIVKGRIPVEKGSKENPEKFYHLALTVNAFIAPEFQLIAYPERQNNEGISFSIAWQAQPVNTDKKILFSQLQAMMGSSFVKTVDFSTANKNELNPYRVLLAKFPTTEGAKLQLRGEGAEGLNWNHGIDLVRVNSDLWALGTSLDLSKVQAKFVHVAEDGTLLWEREGKGNRALTNASIQTFVPEIGETSVSSEGKQELTREHFILHFKTEATSKEHFKVRGWGGGLSWEKGAPLTHIGNDLWTFTLDCEENEKIAYKIVCEVPHTDVKWEQGEDRRIAAGQSAQIIEAKTPEFA